MKKSKQSNKNRSKKHHYLPKYYLKGFTNSKNGFFVYDKQADKIFYTSPNATFFENNLNTVILPKGNSSDFLEELYTSIENQSWNSLDSIRKSTSKTPIELLDRMHLFLFLLVLHWRLPSNIKYVENLSTKMFSENNKLNFLSLKYRNGVDAPKEIKEMLKNSPAFKKASRLIAPFAPFYQRNWSDGLHNWRFLYTGDAKNWYLVGDNPLITRGKYDHDPQKCLEKFVFPVSGKILLVNIKKPLNKAPSVEFTILFNIGVFQRAKRFIACRNKKFLEVLSQHYKIYTRSGRTKTIIPEIFKTLERP